jgi:hypothetical protein
MRPTRTRRWGRPLILWVLLSLALSGCGSKVGSVSGKVTYQGKPLSSGLVIFVDKDGKVSEPAGIQVDGSYTADNVPVGQMTACVETIPLSGGEGGGANVSKDQPRPRYVRDTRTRSSLT